LVTRQVHHAVVVIKDGGGRCPDDRDFRLAHADLGAVNACDIACEGRLA
jgi:hypothetical protein